MYSLDQLPLTTIATLAYGLPETSRIKRKLSNQNVDVHTLMLARIIDQLSMVLYSKMKKGSPKPESVYEKLTQPRKERFGFSSGKDYEIYRQQLIEKINAGKEASDG